MTHCVACGRLEGLITERVEFPGLAVVRTPHGEFAICAVCTRSASVAWAKRARRLLEKQR